MGIVVLFLCSVPDRINFAIVQAHLGRLLNRVIFVSKVVKFGSLNTVYQPKEKYLIEV